LPKCQSAHHLHETVFRRLYKKRGSRGDFLVLLL
jgi:hypothetical protein